MRRDLCLAPRRFTQEIVLAQASALRRLFEKHGVEAAILFGSLVTPGTEGGDLDLAVAGLTDTLGEEQALYEEVCRLFGADNVDLVPFERAPFLVRRRAVLGGLVLYERTPGRVERMVEELLFAGEDFRYAAAMLERELRARLRGGLSVSPRRLDADRVKGYLSQLDVSVRQLAEFARRIGSLDEFTADEDRRDLAVHRLRIALERVLDICRHFLAVQGVSLHELDTTSLIEVAGRKGLFPVAFAQRIRGMAGMRNAIVHVYVDLDYAAIREMVTRRLGDFDEFGRHVLAYLEREED